VTRSTVATCRDSTSIDPAAIRIGKFRWVICALLFLATVINYIDRTTLSVLEPELRGIIGWTDAQWGYLGASFMLAYSVGFPFAGWLMDKLGTRLGFSLSLIVWSLCPQRERFFGGSICAGTRRIGQLPGGDQDHRGVVS
jgi:ACS family hexuronate transporter-like MFS transporter